MGAAGWQQVAAGWQQCRSHQRQHPVNPNAANTMTPWMIRLPSMGRPPGLSAFALTPTFSVGKNDREKGGTPAKSRGAGIAGLGQGVKVSSGRAPERQELETS